MRSNDNNTPNNKTPRRSERIASNKTKRNTEEIITSDDKESNSNKKLKRQNVTVKRGNEEFGKGVTIHGRASTFSGKQGNHSTAYALIEKKIRHVLEEISDGDENSISERTRNARTKLIDFAKLILAINFISNEEAKKISDSLSQGIELVFGEYNKNRYKKTEIRSNSNTINLQLDLFEEIKERILMGDNDELKRLLVSYIPLNEVQRSQQFFERGTNDFNALLMSNSLEQISEILLEYYNQIPFVSFPKQEGANPPSSEGNDIRQALLDLDKLTVESDILNERIEEIVGSIKNLFFYPKVADENLKTFDEKGLMAWQDKEGLKRTARPRDNNVDTLYQVVARHLVITLSVYPELELIKDEIINEFSASVARGWGIDNNNCLREIKKVIDCIAVQKICESTPNKGSLNKQSLKDFPSAGSSTDGSIYGDEKIGINKQQKFSQKNLFSKISEISEISEKEVKPSKKITPKNSTQLKIKTNTNSKKNNLTKEIYEII